ncbi:MAG: DUF3048 domain-containing protein [Candidatus Yanofskybacteria bacterium]|nr:DUF3048 domain-containing protein [Candidatus Yanofskybacteria bacterium]
MKSRSFLSLTLWVFSALALVGVISFLFWLERDIEITGANPAHASPLATPRPKPLVTSSLAGERCENGQRRPIAVTIAGDPITRPLSGISMADLVVEMPVTPNGVTRMMALFQCETPLEIGSIRSSRQDFLPLAAGWDVIYAHWGGEKESLDQLKTGILDEIDALVYEGTVFYRKEDIPRPHNGFTSLSNLIEHAQQEKFSLVDTFSGYPRLSDLPHPDITTLVNTVDLPYPRPFDVHWVYDQTQNVYRRSRNGRPETDRVAMRDVSASVVIILETTGKPLRDQYVRIDVQGQGSAIIYQNGMRIPSTWRKDPTNIDNPLRFFDAKGKEIKFTPGKIWIEITK